MAPVKSCPVHTLTLTPRYSYALATGEDISYGLGDNNTSHCCSCPPEKEIVFVEKRKHEPDIEMPMPKNRKERRAFIKKYKLAKKQKHQQRKNLKRWKK